MAKQLVYDSDAKEKILAGINKLEKATSITLGPAGRNVIIDRGGSIHSTKDGVTVAKSITLSDKFENLGASAIKEVAEKSNTRVGDGTTTSTLLAAAIYRNGLKHVNVGANPIQVKNGIKKAADKVIEIVKAASVAINTKDDIKRVATVSANGDSKIGEMLADVMSQIGKDGTIKIENGNALDMTSEIVEGMVLDQSYASPYLVTHPDTLEAKLDNPVIMIANKKLSNIQEMLPSFQSMSQSGRPIFIIADDFSEEVLSTIVMNRLRGLTICAIKSPSYGDNRKEILQDIATLVGAQVICDETGVSVQNATIDSGILGGAKSVVVTKENTIITGGAGEEIEIAKRADSLRKQIESTTDEYDLPKLQERLARLTAGIGVISVGAPTEAERKELRDRVDDAFCASKSALRSGVVAGGGTALLEAMSKLEVLCPEDAELGKTLVGDEIIGVKILHDSLDAPIRKILDNAGIDASLIVEKLREAKKPNFGYDVLTKTYVDMIEAGIIDPTEVVVNEIQNASSVAGLLLTTECMITDEPEKTSASCGCGHTHF